MTRSFLFLTTSILLLVGLVQGNPAQASPVCPTTIENDPAATPDACGVLINIDSFLKASVSAPGTGPYDGASSSTFGVVNTSNFIINAIFLKGGSAGITDFTGNGITTYLSANGVTIPPTPVRQFGWEDYYGPATMFSNVDPASDSLGINFRNGLLPGTAAYFSLPGDPLTDVAGLTGVAGAVQVTLTTPTPEPEYFAVTALSLIAMFVARHNRHRSFS